jgi:release factor glutamine methyltransferase
MSSSPLADLLDEGVARLREAGIDSARLDAEVLLAHVMGLERGAMLSRLSARAATDAPAGARRTFLDLIERRGRHEPVAYLTGRREFWSLDLEVGPGVLVPRPDTELVVEVSLRLTKSLAAPRVLDIGTGSGAIAVALAVERPSGWIVATDVSEAALSMARRNARRHGVAARVAFAAMDVGAGLRHPDGVFDLVASNPPYIALSERDSLMPDVGQHEPPAALFGGPTGMDVIARLLPDAARLLRPGGSIVMEIASGRAGETAALLEESGVWQDVVLHHDLAGLPRVAAARRATGGP